jgi:hypothetical protein
MLKLSDSGIKELFSRIVANAAILLLIFNADWLIAVGAIIIATIIFRAYFEIILFATILDVYYGNPKYFAYTIGGIAFYFIVYFLRERILIR